MEERNLVDLKNHAEFKLVKTDDGKYLIAVYNVPAGSKLILKGYAIGGGIATEEITATPTKITMQLAEPTLYAECSPSTFQFRLSEGEREIRLHPVPK